MTLLVHVGEEHSVNFYITNLKVKYNPIECIKHSKKNYKVNAGFLDNTLGNPLFLRGALENKVKVISAHMASEGDNLDLENPK